MSKLQVVNVWHVGAWNRNVGDWALAYQMHRLLNEQARERNLHLSFYMVDSQRTRFHPGLVDQMNEEADLVLIGGGGLIFFRPEDRSVSGWSFNITLSDLDRIKPPLVVYGIGHNRFCYDPQTFHDETGPHLRLLQGKSQLFSVRNQGSKRVLIEQFGLDPSKLAIIPDPGIRLYDRPIALSARAKGRPVIAINWAGDRPHYRYPSPAEENAQYFMGVMKAALLKCVKELNAQIMFLPHLLYVDSDCYKGFSEGFPSGSMFATHEELPFLYPPPGEVLYPHVPFFTNLFRHADVLVGMRFHACVIAFGAETRFIPLGSHPKVGYFMEETGVPDYSIRLIDRKEDTVESVFERIRTCLEDSTYKARLKQALGIQIDALEQFNGRLLDVLEARFKH